VTEAHSASAGLDYPGIGPQLSALYEAGRVEVASATDDEAFAAMTTLAAAEGIVPALEPAHAIAALPEIVRRTRVGDGGIVVLGLSGRGDKDLASYEAWLSHPSREQPR
jgi:tryptophan synthase beta chain